MGNTESTEPNREDGGASNYTDYNHMNDINITEEYHLDDDFILNDKIPFLVGANRGVNSIYSQETMNIRSVDGVVDPIESALQTHYTRQAKAYAAADTYFYQNDHTLIKPSVNIKRPLVTVLGDVDALEMTRNYPQSYSVTQTSGIPLDQQQHLYDDRFGDNFAGYHQLQQPTPIYGTTRYHNPWSAGGVYFNAFNKYRDEDGQGQEDQYAGDWQMPLSVVDTYSKSNTVY